MPDKHPKPHLTPSQGGGGADRSLPAAVYEVAAALLASLSGWGIHDTWEAALGYGLAALIGSGAGRFGFRGKR